MQYLDCQMEVKFAPDAPERTFEGYGAVFGNVDAHGDVIVKGAFAESIRETRKGGAWPAMLVQHGGFFGENPTPVGVWTRLEEDERGLKVEGQLADTERGREMYALLNRTGDAGTGCITDCQEVGRLPARRRRATGGIGSLGLYRSQCR